MATRPFRRCLPLHRRNIPFDPGFLAVLIVGLFMGPGSAFAAQQDPSGEYLFIFIAKGCLGCHGRPVVGAWGRNSAERRRAGPPGADSGRVGILA